jgi:hypothetical protein
MTKIIILLNFRILEANGQMLLKLKQEALSTLIKSTSMAQLRLVVLRLAPIHSQKQSAHEYIEEKLSDPPEEMDKSRRIMLERTKQERDQLRAENLRLSHRISYLEEQVRFLFRG